MNNKEIENGTKVLLPAVFSSVDDKKDKFLNELKALLVKYDAELELEDFGRDFSIICKTHYTPVDKVQIEKGRING